MRTPVFVFAQDTDMLILLLYHRPDSFTNLSLLLVMGGLINKNKWPKEHLFNYARSANDTVSSVYGLTKWSKEHLFNYARSNNDTVSSVYGLIKDAIFKCDFPRHVINIFLHIYSYHDEIKPAGVYAVPVTCGCGDTLLEDLYKNLIFSNFRSKLQRSKISLVRPFRTEDTAIQHWCGA